ncbi:MAG: hypothetical protein NW216_02415 [Hyphomicrobium sp.]|nr:hypothetical protein [Hyphomicrobium sp.]
MRSPLAFFAVVWTAVVAGMPALALVDIETSALPGRAREIVVVEVDNCLYCGLFRRDVAPTYRNSQRARSVPMRFVDINAPAFEKLKLDGPVESVPTVIVIEDGREVGRIAGYIGPENFFHSLSRLLPDAD